MRLQLLVRVRVVVADLMRRLQRLRRPRLGQPISVLLHNAVERVVLVQIGAQVNGLRRNGMAYNTQVRKPLVRERL